MSGAELLFYVFAALAVFSSLAMVTRRNPFVGAVWLIATFVALAGTFVMLSASFLGAIQVLVYAGAIMVLFVFVIMVLDVDETGRITHRRPSRIARFGYYGTMTVVLGFVAWVLVGTIARQYVTFGADLADKPEFGTAQSIGRDLFTRYLFPFEAISFLLLAAIVGAVVVARSRKEREAAGRHLPPHAREAAGLEVDDSETGHPRPSVVTLPSASGHQGR